MKNSYIHYLAILSLALFLAACNKIEPDFFDKDYNGAYFDYNNSAEFHYNLNFSDHTSGMPDEVIVPVNIKLLGYLEEKKRSVSIITKEVEGYDLPEPGMVTIPEVFFANKEHKKEIEVRVKRPQVENATYAICLHLDGKGDLGSGINGKEDFYIYITETYEKPELWAGVLETSYIGQWSKEKQIYISNLTGDDEFLKKLYSRITEDSKVYDYEAATRLNVQIFNEFFTEESTEPVTLSFPILSKNDNPQYNEPYFWNIYSDYQCKYTTERFFEINSSFGKVLNTTNIEENYSAEKNIKNVKNKKKEFHIEDVSEMLEKYYSYAASGYPIQEYKDSCWIEMIVNNINNYNVIQPYWWEDPDSLGSAELVEKYYGEYSEDKYKFMIMSMIGNDGSENFVAAKMFPFIRNLETNTFEWDSSIGGEDCIKGCYDIIKKKYEEADYVWDSFSFPELVLE